MRSTALVSSLIVAGVILSGCAAGNSTPPVSGQTVGNPDNARFYPGSLTDTTTLYRGGTLHCIGINYAGSYDGTASLSCDWTRFYFENPDLVKNR